MTKTMTKPTFDGETGQWTDVPAQTTATSEWIVLVLDNGMRILSFGDAFEAGAQVHVLREDGVEVLMWDCAEWGDDPELVMGAILRVAAGV